VATAQKPALRTVWQTVLLTTLVASLGAGVTSAARPDATASFRALIKARYGDQPGYSRCAPVNYSKRELTCWAEIYRGAQYRRIDATATAPRSFHFSKISSRSWTRRWTRISKSIMHDFGAHGTAYANSPVFDWAFLLGAVDSDFRRHKLPASYLVFDGNSSGYPAAIFRFHCALSGHTIFCTNALGDALRFVPA
jgi:hypothetical protein